MPTNCSTKYLTPKFQTPISSTLQFHPPLMEAFSFASFCCLNTHAFSTLLISSSSSLFPHSLPRKSFRPSSASASASFSSSASTPSPPSIRRPDLNRWSSPPSASAPAPTRSRSAAERKRRKNDEMELFLDLVPSRMRKGLAEHGEVRELIEVVMDLGRKPIARFPSGDWIISQEPVDLNDLNHAVSKVGDFSDDNRSGINHSLHRISAIRNRKKQIIGLTCRVGRAILGSAEMIRDLVEGGGSILVIGPPGVGKTTVIREIARMLADEHMKRVVIVDTSNEIGGDGDVPHSGIGRARRMQVPNVDMQHSVMIEAVENHMPEVIIIDEIGTELEALAASTIAQRGVQLVGTAHGVAIESIIKNPCLQTLVGGIESVTLGDDEAKRRKVQKTILERKGPPTFTYAVEMVSKTQYRVHHKLEATVDAILAGKSPMIEVRNLTRKAIDSKLPERHNNEELSINNEKDEKSEMRTSEEAVDTAENTMKSSSKSTVPRSSPVRLYTYKILEADLLQVAQVMGLENDIDITEDITTADAILASSYEMKQNRWIRSVAKYHQLPVFVIKANTMAQMVKAVRMILEMNSFESNLHQPVHPVERDIEIEDDAPKRKPTLEEIDALEEVRLAIEYIVIPGGEPVELLPRCSEIIARQLELVESYQLAAEKSGTGLNSRLQILPQKLNKKFSKSAAASIFSKPQIISSNSLTSENAGASVSRLPLLPE